VRLGGSIRFRTLDGDKLILSAAATVRGQSMSAFVRDAAMAAALEDLGYSNRDEAIAGMRADAAEEKKSRRGKK
jgi:uncharacterized protein (DUF1778 family)